MSEFINNNKQLKIALVAAVFGLGGVLFIAFSNAAAPTAGVEVEGGTKTTNASQVSDTTASGGSAVLFNAPVAAGTCAAGNDVPGSADRWAGCWPGANNTGWQH